MKISREDLANKLECLSGYLRYENKIKIDKSFYDNLCDESDEFCKRLREEKLEVTD